MEDAQAIEDACRLLLTVRTASLATLDGDGGPSLSLVTPAPDGSGVLLLLSDLAVHTGNLRADPRCALLLAGDPVDGPQTAPRLGLRGVAAPEADPACRAAWRRSHPEAFYADFADFRLWRLTPAAATLIGGFARAHRLAVPALWRAMGNRMTGSGDKP